MIVGIDLSLASTGMAFLFADGHIRLLTVSSPPGPIEPRLLDILRQINAHVRTVRPELVVIEDISQGSFGQSGGFLERVALFFMLRIHLHSVGIPFEKCSAIALKKFVVGSGGSKKNPVKKEHMIKAVLQRWGIDTASNDEADAAGLAYVGAAILDRIPAANEAQREVVAKILAGPVKKMRTRKEMA